MAMVVFNTTNLALLQELSWVPCSGEIHQEQIYRIRDWWGDVIQPVGKRQQNNTTDTPSRCGRFHQVAGVQCWQPYNTFMAKSQTQHLKQRKEEITDTVYHSLGLCSKLSLCVAGSNPGISLEQGPVYHAYCGDIFQEVWCTSSHLTVHHFWWSRARHLFCSWAAENSHALHQGEFASDQICWQF